MKNNFRIYRLYFTTPLHLGNEREDYAESLRTLHSDTFYAALTSALAKTGVIGNDFNGDLKCTISSLFPFYQKDKQNEPVYFFPKSKKIEILEEKLFDIHKYIKKILWMDKTFFERHLNGESFSDKYGEKIIVNNKEKPKYLKGSYLTGHDIPEDFIISQVFPHARVPRQMMIDEKKQDTDIFYMERLFFKDHSGMFFIADGDTTLLEKGLKILQHEGIGTDRNVGNGYFCCKADNIDIELPDDADYIMNLSLFLPESKDILEKMIDNNSAYNFIKRGGWITTHPHNTIRKNRVFMFEEGSVFKGKAVTNGRIADLTPDLSAWQEEKQLEHNIYRNGKSIFIPTKLAH